MLVYPAERGPAGVVLPGAPLAARGPAAARHWQQAGLPGRRGRRAQGAPLLRRHRLAAGLPAEVHAAPDTAARRGQRRRRLRHRQLRRGGHQGHQAHRRRSGSLQELPARHIRAVAGRGRRDRIRDHQQRGRQGRLRFYGA